MRWEEINCEHRSPVGTTALEDCRGGEGLTTEALQNMHQICCSEKEMQKGPEWNERRFLCPETEMSCRPSQKAAFPPQQRKTNLSEVEGIDPGLRISYETRGEREKMSEEPLVRWKK